jgi:hypothetical protein
MKTKALTLKGARVRFGEQIDRAKAVNKTEAPLPAPILMPTPVNSVE